MITYQVESYAECKGDIDALLPRHWEEIALDKDVIPMDKDEQAYQRLADEGKLHIVTVRKDGKVIGYHATIVQPHLHYKSTLMGFTDVYYIVPEERKGRVGIELFKKVEETLHKRGVVKLSSGTKTHKDMSRLFEYMGWTETEVMFTKVITR